MANKYVLIIADEPIIFSWEQQSSISVSTSCPQKSSSKRFSFFLSVFIGFSKKLSFTFHKFRRESREQFIITAEWFLRRYAIVPRTAYAPRRRQLLSRSHHHVPAAKTEKVAFVEWFPAVNIHRRWVRSLNGTRQRNAPSRSSGKASFVFRLFATFYKSKIQYFHFNFLDIFRLLNKIINDKNSKEV